jgi:hypothetical protein
VRRKRSDTSAVREPRRLESLRVLLGAWRAVSAPGEPEGGFAFEEQLQGRVIVRQNHADYAASDSAPAWRHEDLMVIYDEGRLRADYFDSEGHVIRYAGEITGDEAVSFTSLGDTAGPVFRLSYRVEDGTLRGAFEIGDPGSDGAFRPYLAWSAVREA